MPRPLFEPADRAQAEVLAAINGANPFLPERVELERRLLGAAFLDIGAARARVPGRPDADPNSPHLLERAAALLERARVALEGLEPGTSAEPRDVELYEDVALFTLFFTWNGELTELAEAEGNHSDSRPARRAGANSSRVEVPWYPRFRDEAVRLLRPGGRPLSTDLDPPHLLALLYQIARAFHHIHANLLGTSVAAVRLRAAVWQSIFTHDIRRYRRSVFGRMRDLSTLVTGPSGTGKELVARAIGLSGYLPFDPRNPSFAANANERLLPLNLSALSPTLIESELFGHKRGAFTGALADRRGWFELCPDHGAVFLDEIGEISTEIQLKLLRVLQTRSFQRLGESEDRTFRGKLVSATNRDLEEAMANGSFREDLYFRICSDRISTPPLAEQVDGDVDELHTLVLFIARDLVGDEAPELAEEVVEWVDRSLGRDYAWPGNFRELEQCVRSVLVRREYRPRIEGAFGAGDPRRRLSREFEAGSRSADELLRAYCTLVYAREGSFDGAARVLGLDRRTVKAKLDRDFLDELNASDPAS